MKGRVVSIKMKDTATVLVERVAVHPLYKKTFVRSKKYLVMVEAGVKEGDVVEIIKTRPISKNKHWKIIKVIGKDLEAITAERLKAEAEEVIAEVMPEEKVEEPEEPKEPEKSKVEEKKKGGSKEVKSQKSKVKRTIKK